MMLRKWQNIFLVVLISLVIVIECFAITLDNFKIKKIIVDGRELRVAIADTLEKREQGLSNTDLKDLKRKLIDGMLFIFDDENEKTFQAWYMKYDLMLLVLEKRRENYFMTIERIPLRIGTTAKAKGKWVLEIPIKKD